jgi:hypothetical protein
MTPLLQEGGAAAGPDGGANGSGGGVGGSDKAGSKKPEDDDDEVFPSDDDVLEDAVRRGPAWAAFIDKVLAIRVSDLWGKIPAISTSNKVSITQPGLISCFHLADN